MAKRKSSVNKNLKKIKKSHPGLYVVIVVLLLIIGLGVAYYFESFDSFLPESIKASTVFKKSTNSSNTGGNNGGNQGGNGQGDNHAHAGEDGIVENIKYDNFQIHFLELGNEYTGDSTYIKAGDVDILIDAGSRSNSAESIVNYVKTYCTDGKLEYVISTHNHQDHISGFAGNSQSKAKNAKGEPVGRTGVLYYFEVGTFIDFSYARLDVKDPSDSTGKKKITMNFDNKIQNSADYGSLYGSNTEYCKYLAAREYAVSKGTTWYTAKELWNNNNTTFNLTSDVTMDILYNYYYFNETTDANNYSVCTMFNYNDHHFLLTGDLEKEGEENLVAYYNDNSSRQNLPHCDLFKGGHHGSYTASNEVLLNAITPDICCVCCCAGSSEYTNRIDNQFPSQEFINRIAKHTSRVYVTTLYDETEKKNKSFNGIIVVSFNGTNVGLFSSVNNLTRLKDSEWFNAEIYVKQDSKGYNINCSGAGKSDFYTTDTTGATKVKRRIWPSYGVA